MKAWILFSCLAGFLLGALAASVPPPESWRAATPLDFGFDIHRITVSHNNPEAIRQELLDPATLRLLGKSQGLSDKDLESVVVAQRPGTNWVQLYQLGKSGRAFKILNKKLRDYIRAREEGHTRAFSVAAVTNNVSVASIADPDIRLLVADCPHVLASWLRRAGSGTLTNKARVETERTTTTRKVNGKEVTYETVHIPKMDERCRWVSYTCTDGDITWRYYIQFKANGSLLRISEERVDAKEHDPRYQKVIGEIEKEVIAAMKKSGIHDQLGSCYRFWDLKKEKLRAKGIEWRSPAELNPNICYD